MEAIKYIMINLRRQGFHYKQHYKVLKDKHDNIYFESENKGVLFALEGSGLDVYKDMGLAYLSMNTPNPRY